MKKGKEKKRTVSKRPSEKNTTLKASRKSCS